VSVTSAHIAGIPLEEGLLPLVPAVGALAVVARASLGRIVGWLRRR